MQDAFVVVGMTVSIIGFALETVGMIGRGYFRFRLSRCFQFQVIGFLLFVAGVLIIVAARMVS